MSTKTVEKTKTTTTEPPRYKVLIINDDYTPVDFVIYALKRYFGLQDSAAEKVTQEAHNTGLSVAGIYPFEIAETKANQAMKDASNKGFPFSCMLEAD